MQVHCWNKEYGCDAAIHASEVHKHFQQDCSHHSICCPRCGATISRSNAWAHLQSKCSDCIIGDKDNVSETPTYAEKERALLALKATVEESVDEMRQRLDALLCENRVQSDRMNELSHCMNAMKEAFVGPRDRMSITKMGAAAEATGDLTTTEKGNGNFGEEDTLLNMGELLRETTAKCEAINTDIRKTLEILENSVHVTNSIHAQGRQALSADLHKVSCTLGTLKKTFGEELQRVSKTITEAVATKDACLAALKNSMEKYAQEGLEEQMKLLAYSTSSFKRYETFFKGVKSLKGIALSKGLAFKCTPSTYLKGYSVSLGVCFKADVSGVSLHACIHLHKGIIDEFLPWPFHEDLRLTVQNGATEQVREHVNKARRSLVHMGRPGPSSNQRMYFPERSFSLEDLERDGYVVDDTIHVIFELL
ncbi:hypothetical protein HPB50_004531 [Hyalomma asiaticum]|uniref:Uncharacterized protein n=1 Tax=Hyalomma asiaticum TaxID=266040 RepID=A0ACB7RYM2_HYAAI|nr:hypothetical protein HPB50_004531 [Hyalomma asiaticum]